MTHLHYPPPRYKLLVILLLLPFFPTTAYGSPSTRSPAPPYPASRHPCIPSGCAVTINRTVPSSSFTSCPLAPSNTIPIGNHGDSTATLRFVPFFPQSLGFLPTASLANGASVHALPFPITSELISPSRHIHLKNPACAHSLKYLWMLLPAPYSADSAFHWIPIRNT